MSIEKQAGAVSPKKKKKKRLKYWQRFLIKLVIAGLIVYLVLTKVLCVYRVTGNNMYPAIRDGDLCIFYRIGNSTLHDVSIYRTPDGVNHIGRIVAVEGQVIEFGENGYTIEGYQPAEEIFYPTEGYKDTLSDYPLTVAPNSFYILNDHRIEKDDSRKFGSIPASDIYGQLIFVLRRRGF